MLIINNELVSQLLTMEDCIRVQEEAFRKLPTGGAIHRPRIDMYFPCEREDSYFRWGTMEGANDGYFAIRMKSDIMTWPKDANGNWTEEKYCREPGTYCGVVFLLSTRNAEPLAFINDGVLQHMRVGGDSPEFMDRGKGGDKPDFADLVSGKCPGRTGRDQVTFYRNVGNQGLQFSSVGGWVHAQAVKARKGREIPTEWFLQDIRD